MVAVASLAHQNLTFLTFSYAGCFYVGNDSKHMLPYMDFKVVLIHMRAKNHFVMHIQIYFFLFLFFNRKALT